jgi:glucose dehydrogenase
MRRILAGMVLSGLASVAVAADKRIPLPGGETMVIGWNPAWVVGELDDDDAHGSVTFNGGDRKVWSVMISPLPPHPTLTGDTGNLRIYVRGMVRALEFGGVTVDPEHKTIEGGTTKGFYVRAHDVKANAVAQTKSDHPSEVKTKSTNKPKGIDYAHGYVGAISANGRPFVFEVLWNAGGEQPAQGALAAMRTVRIQ